MLPRYILIPGGESTSISKGEKVYKSLNRKGSPTPNMYNMKGPTICTIFETTR